MKKQQKAWAGLSKVWARNLYAFPVFLLSIIAAAATPALAAEPSKQRAVYEVYAGGFHALQATVDIALTRDNRYDIFITTKTRGLLGKLAPWSGTFETHGRALKDGRRYPVQHKSVGNWRGEIDIKDYSYDGKNHFNKITIDEHDKDPHTPDIDPEITDNTIDALTAALLVFENYNKTQQCAGTSKVFDGKRSYEQKFMHQKTAKLKTSRYNIYAGAAAECTVEVVPLKGKWHKKPRGWISVQEQGRERGSMPTLWLASLSETAPAIPVKIRVQTAYGTLFMHLAEYQNGEQIIMAQKRAKDGGDGDGK